MISWTDKVTYEDVLRKVNEDKQCEIPSLPYSEIKQRDQIARIEENGDGQAIACCRIPMNLCVALYV